MMIEYLKQKFLEEPEKIKILLEEYDYHNIIIHNTYMSFGRSPNSSAKSIVIRLQKNDALIVHDYARNVVCDLFNFICKTRPVTFREVIRASRNVLGITESYYYKQAPKSAFSSFYGNIKNKDKVELKVYPEEILNKYSCYGNKRFVKDGISVKTQKAFQIGYDVESQSITIPIRNESGQLVGVKERINRDPQDGEQKYFYSVPTMMSQILYGFSENYEYLEGADVIYVFESEKSVLQCRDMNIRSCLALGSSSISKKQCQLLLSLNPKKVVFCYDKGLEREAIERAIKTLRTYGKMKEFEIWYTNMEDDDKIPDKSSPSDLGRQGFEYVIKHKIVKAEE